MALRKTVILRSPRSGRLEGRTASIQHQRARTGGVCSLLAAGIRLILIAAAMLGASRTASADGTVLRAKGCGDKIFVMTGTSYSVLTATGTSEGVSDGDRLIGEVERIGFSMLYDRNSGRSISAIVEDYRLDRARINQRIAVSCRTFPSNAFASGTVSRAAGCNDRIIVNTEKG